MDKFTVTGQDMQDAPETDIQVKTSKTNLKVVDNSVTNNTSTTTTTTVFNSIK